MHLVNGKRGRMTAIPGHVDFIFLVKILNPLQEEKNVCSISSLLSLIVMGSRASLLLEFTNKCSQSGLPREYDESLFSTRDCVIFGLMI